MTRDEWIFLVVLAVNFLVALAYLLIACFLVAPGRIHKEKRRGVEVVHDKRSSYVLRFIVMLLCPVAGPLFFLGAYLFHLALFWLRVDLEDVAFRKERVKTHLKADEERGRGIVPLEEAVLVSGEKDLRQVMMNTIRGDVAESLSAISTVLNVEDSESSHYAAAVLSDKLDEFRAQCQKLYEEMETEDPQDTSRERALLRYMDGVLRQNIFTQLEQRRYVRMMELAAESFFGKDPGGMTAHEYESVCLRLMECGQMERAAAWCARLWEQRPGELCAYTCRLKLYFSQKNREAFFRTLEELRQSDVVLDSETLELVRIFS